MDKQRIYGMEVDLDNVSDSFIGQIRDMAESERLRAIGYVTMLDFKLLQRTLNPLPFEDEYLEGYAEVADGIPYDQRLSEV